MCIYIKTIYDEIAVSKMIKMDQIQDAHIIRATKLQAAHKCFYVELNNSFILFS